MNSSTRRELLDRLDRVGELAPDLRFGQLIADVTFLAAGPWDRSLWDVGDEELLSAVRQFEDDLARRAERPPTNELSRDAA